MASLTDTIYDIADQYTDDSKTNVTNAKIQSAASGFMTTLNNARSAGDLSGTYSYSSDISTTPTGFSDSDIGIDAIKESSLRTKIRSANTVFNFKNTVNSKYIIVYDKQCYLFASESNFDDVMSSFRLKLADEIYSGVNLTATYNSSLSNIMSNHNNHI
tara:strand:+ start:4526 stop:5002 length:477 start_codon:yes stop_codon:yes gene_type:complete